MTIDVEEYFHIEAAHGVVPRGDWHALPSRVERSTEALLELFAATRATATFFFLGDVARRVPSLVRRCREAGHEVASHGTMHDRLHRLDAPSMLADVRDSKSLLEDLIGEPIFGYRAPTWSLTRDTAWAVDVLAEAGFAYDASVFPVRHPAYGVPDAPTRPYVLRGTRREILEVPPLTWRVAGRNLAAAGGGYFRLLPLGLMRRALLQASAEQRPAILYFHPWEFDPDIPRLPLSHVGRFRTYTGLASATARLERLLRDITGWRSIASHLATLHASAANAAPFRLAA